MTGKRESILIYNISKTERKDPPPPDDCLDCQIAIIDYSSFKQQ